MSVAHDHCVQAAVLEAGAVTRRPSVGAVKPVAVPGVVKDASHTDPFQIPGTPAELRAHAPLVGDDGMVAAQAGEAVLVPAGPWAP